MIDKEQTEVKITTTAIKRCSCTHAYQDEAFGRGMRLHNLTDQSKPVATRKWRCTVCSVERD